MTRLYSPIVIVLCASLLPACGKGEPTPAPSAAQDAAPRLDAGGPGVSQSEGPSEEGEARFRSLTHPRKDLEGPLTEGERASMAAFVEGLPGKFGHEVTALVAFGKDAEPHVSELLEHPSARMRVLGVQFVSKGRMTRLYSKVGALLDDKDARVRRAVVDFVGLRGDEEMVRRLLPLVENNEPASRVRATRILSERGVRSIVPALRKRAAVERRVWRLRTLEALSLLARVDDFEWFKSEYEQKEGAQSYNEEVALWEAMAASDPDRAWGFLDAERKRKGERFSERSLFTAMMYIAPRVPEEAILEEAKKLEVRFRPRLRHLVRALALSPGEQASAEVAKLLSRNLYTCDILGARLEREARLIERVSQLEAAASAEPEGASKKSLVRSLEAAKRDLAWVSPLARNAAQKLVAEMESERVCRAEVGALGVKRVEGLLGSLESPTASVRRGVALILARHGQWPQVGHLMGVLWDADPGVRRAARKALRKIIGHDLRLPTGFAYEHFFLRSLGPLPKTHHPVTKKDDAHRLDLSDSFKRRAPSSGPVSSSSSNRRPVSVEEPGEKLKRLKSAPRPMKGTQKGR